MKGTQKFVLNSVDEIIEKMKRGHHFKRHEMREYWNAIKAYRNYQGDKKTNLRGQDYGKCPQNILPSKGSRKFVFQLLDSHMEEISYPRKNNLNRVLHSLSDDWYFRVGQYFFFNLFGWVKKFKGKQQFAFLYHWWDRFLEYHTNTSEAPELAEYPEHILLELTNNCNLNCIMCGVGSEHYDETRNMPLSFLEKLKAENQKLFENAKIIRLNGLGESTIIPDFLDYLNILETLDAQLEIVTNLTQPNQEIWKRLIDLETVVLISCDSAEEKTYEMIRRGGNFTQFLENLQYVGENVSHPLNAHIIFTLMEQNVDHLMGVIKLAQKNNIGGLIVNVVKKGENQNTEECMWEREEKKLYRKVLSQFRSALKFAREHSIQLKLPDHLGHLPVPDPLSTTSCKEKCKNPWKECYVRYNGDITVCNMMNPYLYGNLKTQTFSDLWSGLNAYIFRSLVNTPHRHPYCDECYYLT